MEFTELATTLIASHPHLYWSGGDVLADIVLSGQWTWSLGELTCVRSWWFPREYAENEPSMTTPSPHLASLDDYMIATRGRTFTRRSKTYRDASDEYKFLLAVRDHAPERAQDQRVYSHLLLGARDNYEMFLETADFYANNAHRLYPPGDTPLLTGVTRSVFDPPYEPEPVNLSHLTAIVGFVRDQVQITAHSSLSGQWRARLDQLHRHRPTAVAIGSVDDLLESAGRQLGYQNYTVGVRGKNNSSFRQLIDRCPDSKILQSWHKTWDTTA
jgi:hypothetical protein